MTRLGCLGLALILLPTLAHAEGKPSPVPSPLDQTLRGPAKDAYTYAKLLFGHGDFSGALIKYEQAYAASRDPRLLFNMALCERNLRAYARAQALLQRYKTESGPTLSQADREAVDAALVAIENLVGKLTLTIEPAGASVVVDGAPAGSAPLGGPIVLDLGKHAVVVSKEGFESVEKAVEVAGGSSSVVTVKLARRVLAAHLVVSTDEGAVVVVDGRQVGTGRFDGSLPAGVHDIELTEHGKQRYSGQVDLRQGETRTLQVTLQNQAQGPTVWPWIVGGAAVVAGATVGGYFLLKSSPQQPAGVNGDFASVRFNVWTGR